MASLAETIEQLPAPFDRESFSAHRQGIYDCSETTVYLNEAADFAFLHPRPEFDYDDYQSRMNRLNLSTYKKTLPVVKRRYEKISHCFSDRTSVLEIGAADASFLSYLKNGLPAIQLASIEVDQNTRAGRDELPGLVQFATFDEVDASENRFDVICMFHVLEHVFEPAEMLGRCVARLAPGGKIVIEVPSLDDPLLSLYRVDAYEQFYFQRQHPYVYSKRSLARLVQEIGLEAVELIDHQRYGLENHLQWLAAGVPGGNESFRDALGSCEDSYLRAIEAAGRADTVIAVVRAPAA